MNPHLSQPIARRGCALEDARAAAVMVHGRGRDTGDILALADRIALPGIAYLAPAASGQSWYPNRFMEPVESNQPWLDDALECVHALVEGLLLPRIPAERVVLLGFSQGACLIAEYAVRHARRYGGIVALTGGLIGPAGTRWDAGGSFDGTPVFLGGSDVDEWVPESRVRETARVMRHMGAQVTLRIYPAMEHTVNDDEIAEARRILETAAGRSDPDG